MPRHAAPRSPDARRMCHRRAQSPAKRSVVSARERDRPRNLECHVGRVSNTPRATGSRDLDFRDEFSRFVRRQGRQEMRIRRSCVEKGRYFRTAVAVLARVVGGDRIAWQLALDTSDDISDARNNRTPMDQGASNPGNTLCRDITRETPSAVITMSAASMPRATRAFQCESAGRRISWRRSTRTSARGGNRRAS
jgi:hypothetical protein